MTTTQREKWQDADTLVRHMYLHDAPNTRYAEMRHETPALVDLWESRAGTIAFGHGCIDYWRAHVALPARASATIEPATNYVIHD